MGGLLSGACVINRIRLEFPLPTARNWGGYLGRTITKTKSRHREYKLRLALWIERIYTKAYHGGKANRNWIWGLGRVRRC